MMKYFAYGSNLSKRQMADRCSSAVPLGIATLKGYKVLFRSSNPDQYGVATVEKDASQEVTGGLWEITPSDLKALDRYEGYPYLYTRVNLKVWAQGKPIKAIVYVMTPGNQLSLPSAYYMAVIAEGLRDFGLGRTLLGQAYQNTKIASPSHLHPSRNLI